MMGSLYEALDLRIYDARERAAYRRTIEKAIKAHQIILLNEVLTMNGWHEGDWKESIKQKLATLLKGEKE